MTFQPGAGLIFATMKFKTIPVDRDRPKPTTKTWAIDFETFFDKDCSVKKLGNLAYFNHPDFDAYLVTAHSSDGETFCGHPSDFDWTQLDACIVVSHNASFDETLYQWGRDNKGWKKAVYAAWHCTADLCAYHALPRNLGMAAKAIYDLPVDKSIRDRMSGKRFEKLEEDKQEEFRKYAMEDARLCLFIWLDLSENWPCFERKVSDLNRTICRRGIEIDTDALTENLGALKHQLFEAENSIPWNGEKKLLSRPAFNEECRKVGIKPPASLAQDNPLAVVFTNKYAEEYPWIKAVQEWRRINSMLQKLEAFDRSILADGRYYGGIFYFGAHTGRFSGSGGNLNLQNLPRGEMFGVTMRNLIKSPEGKKLIVADLSQIEVRTLCHLAGDKAMLKEIAEADDIYETFAIRFGRWSKDKGSIKKNAPDLRHSVKQTVLGCGYQASGERYAAMESLTLEEGNEAVETYRKSMPKVVNYWGKLKGDLAVAADQGLDYTIELDSGRVLNYGKIKRMKDTTVGDGKVRWKYFATITKQGRPATVGLFGGKLAENASQALARDIFCDIMLRVADAGHAILFHVHDELVVEVDEEKAEEALAEILNIMSTPPAWLPTIPLAAEGKVLDVYEK